jgi:hypothetical protein
MNSLDALTEAISAMKINSEEFYKSSIEVVDAINYQRDLEDISHKLTEDVMISRQENINNGVSGSVRIGKVFGRYAKQARLAKTDGYVNIIVSGLNKSTLGKNLSPYALKDNYGRLFGNIWKYSKIHSYILDSTRNCETHYADNISENYWKWRKNMNCEYTDSYIDAGCPYLGHIWPADYLGSKMTAKSLESIDSKHESDTLVKVDDSRNEIFMPLYLLLSKKTSDFASLKLMIKEGYNIQLLDSGLTELYQEPGDSGAVNEEVIRTAVKDLSNNFSHVFVLAAALLDKEDWLY